MDSIITLLSGRGRKSSSQKDGMYHPLSLTPSGEKRNPMSYGPFLGGRRVCMGKAFSESVVKVIISMVLQMYTIELHDKDHYVNKPFIIGTPRDPPVYIDVKKRHIDYS